MLIFVLFSIIFLFYISGFLSFNTIAIFSLIAYWLPKFIVINLLEYFYPKILTRNTHSGRYIALTFDDAISPSCGEIIKLLDKHSMKGTFFVISSTVTEENIDILIGAVKNGHQLGNHGKTDSIHFLKNDVDLIKEISHCDHIIRDIYKRANVPLPKKMVYRPGSGLFHSRMLEIVENMGYVLALGSVYPNDPVVRSPGINYLYLMNHIEKGDIVILHDRSWTVPLIKDLMEWLYFNNLESTTINKIIN